MLKLSFGVMLIAAMACTAAAAQGQPSKSPVLAMDRFEGSSVKTELGFGIVLNKNSTLKREWFVIRDPASPVQFDGATGVTVVYKDGGRASGSYQYQASYTVMPSQPVVAYELRYVVLDVFGRLLKSLSATEVEDRSNPVNGTAQWRIWSENEASEVFASVAYVANVRTSSGTVYEANRAAIFEQVRKVSRRISEADLEPKREGPPGRN